MTEIAFQSGWIYKKINNKTKTKQNKKTKALRFNVDKKLFIKALFKNAAVIVL